LRVFFRHREDVLEEKLPGRQGRLLFAYLAVNRARSIPRSELLHILWPKEAPAAAESGLAAILAKLRRALGNSTFEGKHDLRLMLPADAWIESGLGLGGAEIPTAERAARRLTELAPLRETGYRLLMQALVARDDVGEALMMYERLRTVLREELGVSPGPLTQALHRQILKGTNIAPPAE
jgi:DNA-binding SARP family transcriptional activator